ncbi:MAG: recombinase family protein [Lachnospiraceae bacterium]|nr:recombinase family protein [Lachnospiraceae bacterium]
MMRIYAEYMVDGRSFLQIRRGLEADGILNGAGNARWYESNIKQILTNEKYIGDALLQKTYTVNTFEKKRVANNGIVPKYYVEGSHEAIIDKDVFLRVQAEIARRANILTEGKKRGYSARYALSSLVVCGHCEDIYRRIKWNNRGCKSTVWRWLRQSMMPGREKTPSFLTSKLMYRRWWTAIRMRGLRRSIRLSATDRRNFLKPEKTRRRLMRLVNPS